MYLIILNIKHSIIIFYNYLFEKIKWLSTTSKTTKKIIATFERKS